MRSVETGPRSWSVRLTTRSIGLRKQYVVNARNRANSAKASVSSAAFRLVGRWRRKWTTRNFRPGQILEFHGVVKDIAKHEATEVVRVDNDGVRGTHGCRDRTDADRQTIQEFRRYRGEAD